MVRSRRLPRIVLRIRRRKTMILAWFVGILVLVSISIFVFDAKMRPVIRDYAYSRAMYIAGKIVNDAVNEEIAESGVEYTDLISLDKDDSGRVTALHTNIIKINKLKTSVATNVLDQLKSMDLSELRIPIGTISGVDFLAGFGPNIRIQIIPLGQAEASFGSEFTSAGINQTRHRITMEVTANVTIVLPRESIETKVTTYVDVAETVIVGTVPDSYFDLSNSGGENLLGSINDIIE